MAGGDADIEFTNATEMTGWTEAGCPTRALFRQEQRMQDSLATVERFEVSGERLALHSEGGQVLVFDRVGE